MPGILYVVATPIGNLEDVTLRALRILREVSLIAAEDTRRTARLLQHYSISTPTTSLHEHNERRRIPHLLTRLRQGDSIALVSDAGTPGISDPGSRLVSAAHREGFAVLPVPGASAVAAAVSAAGLGAEGFLFAGFPPPKRAARQQWLRALDAHRVPLVFYEAPHRIRALLEDLAAVLGERTVAVGRELTKVHESLQIRPIDQWIAVPLPEQGEYVVIVAARPESAASGDPTDDETLAEEFYQMTENGAISRRDALKAIATRHGVSARRVFAAVEEAKKSTE